MASTVRIFTSTIDGIVDEINVVTSMDKLKVLGIVEVIKETIEVEVMWEGIVVINSVGIEKLIIDFED